MEVVRAVVAGLLIEGDLRDFYGHNGLALDLLHREAGAKRWLHLGCQAAEVLLELARIAHAHDLEAASASRPKSRTPPPGRLAKAERGLKRSAGVPVWAALASTPSSSPWRRRSSEMRLLIASWSIL